MSESLNPLLRPHSVALIYRPQNQILLMLRRKNGKAYAMLPNIGYFYANDPRVLGQFRGELG